MEGLGSMKTKEEIRQFRESLGLSVTDFAANLGVSASTVASWEAGRRRIGHLAQRQLARMEAQAAKLAETLKNYVQGKAERNS